MVGTNLTNITTTDTSGTNSTGTSPTSLSSSNSTNNSSRMGGNNNTPNAMGSTSNSITVSMPLSQGGSSSSGTTKQNRPSSSLEPFGTTSKVLGGGGGLDPLTPIMEEQSISRSYLRRGSQDVATDYEARSTAGSLNMSRIGFDFTGSDDGDYYTTDGDDATTKYGSGIVPGGTSISPNDPSYWNACSNPILRNKLLILLLCLGIVSILLTTMYRTMVSMENTNFETNFYDAAVLVTDHIETQFAVAVGAMYELSSQFQLATQPGSYSTAVTNIQWPFTNVYDYEQHIQNLHEKSNQQQWPFVTMVDFERAARATRRYSHSIAITQHPILQNQQQYDKWISEYVIINDHKWINETLQYQKQHESTSSSLSNTGVIKKDIVYKIQYNIWNFTTQKKIEGSLSNNALPMWQSSPIVSSTIPLYNQDGFLLLDPSTTQTTTVSDANETLNQVTSASVVSPYPVNAFISPIANYPSSVSSSSDAAAMYTKWMRPYVIGNHQVGEDEEEVGQYTDGRTEKDPFSFIYYPILIDTDEDVSTTTATTDAPTTKSKKVVGYLSAAFFWKDYIKGILDPTTTEEDEEEYDESLVVVLQNPCKQTVSFQINGPDVSFMGIGDLHNPKFSSVVVKDVFAIGANKRLVNPVYNYDTETVPFTTNQDSCTMYTLSLYPTQDMEDAFVTSKPLIILVGSSLVLFVILVIFIMYDRWMDRRQQVITRKAIQSSAIVSSLFPKVVRDRLLNPNGEVEPLVVDTSHHGNNPLQPNHPQPTKLRLKSFLHTGGDLIDDMNLMGETKDSSNGGLAAPPMGPASQPIADLFLETTVMFADIAGFTAWCSVREPPQVFILLESIYGEFDSLAKRRNVFKVETIGDSYVAVTGLPEPMDDHAVAMAKFARDCRIGMNEVCIRLEKTLGPDTADLQLRFGLHSGPVTAGVLRGAKGRFQLFGDTVNTASRMESCGMKGKIHVSQTTADQLIEAGKCHWITKREDLVEAKGKGLMQTYWVEPSGPSKPTKHKNPMEQRAARAKETESRNDRLVDWIVEIMDKLIRNIIARRNATKSKMRNIGVITDAEFFTLASSAGETVLDEVREIVELPEFDAKAFLKQEDPETIQLSLQVKSQLQQYVTSIAGMYNNNPFHNFEHAAHVTMSVTKLMSRIVAPDQIIEDDYMKKANSAIDGNNLASTLHDHTYGITSDPLTQFACVFSSLIHDVDHPGVPNSQLATEDKVLAEVYRGKSIAEQNSIDLAWDLFTSSHFFELRKAICGTEPEMRHFRQLVINSVMATDIMDPDLKKLRNNRWDVAFKHGSAKDTPRDKINRKATIVIEHIIQASDVAHTMQHWHVYRKWNERLFEEMYQAYHDGRAEKDPSEFWYKGEIGFFDFYIIPLAKKLSECGVFGVSSDEYLNYALRNREEWERRGEEVLAQMIEAVKSKIAANSVITSVQQLQAGSLHSNSIRKVTDDKYAASTHGKSSTNKKKLPSIDLNSNEDDDDASSSRSELSDSSFDFGIVSPLKPVQKKMSAKGEN